MKIIAGGLFGLVCTGAAFFYTADPDLGKIHTDIVANYSDLEHIDAADFAELDKADIVVFDVREQDEFDVSHIVGARRVDPGIDAQAFITTYGDLLAGKTAVFYCSVGRRSSDLLNRVDDMLSEKDVEAAYNLTGGLFNWSNEQRPLMRDGQATSAIHPYNGYWGRLITDKDAISYKPSSE